MQGRKKGQLGFKNPKKQCMLPKASNRDPAAFSTIRRRRNLRPKRSQYLESLRSACLTSLEQISQDPDPTNTWVQVFKKSRLEGLKDVVKPKTPLHEKILKGIGFALSLTYGVFLIYQYLKYGRNSPTVLSIHQKKVSLQHAPFPAISVCNSHIFLKSKIEEARRIHNEAQAQFSGLDDDGNEWTTKEATTLLFLMDHICENINTFSDHFTQPKSDSLSLRNYVDFVKKNYVPIDDDPDSDLYQPKIVPFIKQSIVNCSETIVACTWDGVERSCNEIFVPVQTDMGVCCTFNKMPEKLLKKNRSILDLLHKHKINMTDEKYWKDWNIDKHFQSAGKFPNEIPRRQKIAGQKYGLSFLFLSNDDEFMCPNTDGQGFTMHLHPSMDEPEIRDKGFLIPLNRHTVVKIKADLTLPGDGLKDLDKEQRGCYFEGEYDLKYYTRYSETNCFRECLVKSMKAKCNCTQLFLPKETGDRLCGPLDQICAMNAERELFQDGYAEACTECLPLCTEIKYSEKVSYNDFNNWKIFNGLGENFGENKTASIVHAFIDSKSMLAHERNVRLTTSDKVGTIGGILGLTNGLSFIRMIDVANAMFIGIVAYVRGTFKCIFKRTRISPHTDEEADNEDEDEITKEWKYDRKKTLRKLAKYMKEINEVLRKESERIEETSNPVQDLRRNITGEEDEQYSDSSDEISSSDYSDDEDENEEELPRNQPNLNETLQKLAVNIKRINQVLKKESADSEDAGIGESQETETSEEPIEDLTNISDAEEGDGHISETSSSQHSDEDASDDGEMKNNTQSNHRRDETIQKLAKNLKGINRALKVLKKVKVSSDDLMTIISDGEDDERILDNFSSSDNSEGEEFPETFRGIQMEDDDDDDLTEVVSHSGEGGSSAHHLPTLPNRNETQPEESIKGKLKWAEFVGKIQETEPTEHKLTFPTIDLNRNGSVFQEEPEEDFLDAISGPESSDDEDYAF